MWNKVNRNNEKKGNDKQHFILKETATLGSSTLKCYPNGAEDIMRGDERIYVEMLDGDILTREITTVEYSEGDDATVVSLNTPVDRDLFADNGNHIIISRLLLVRFDRDTIEVNLQSNVVGEVSLKFRELPKEYTEV